MPLIWEWTLSEDCSERADRALLSAIEAGLGQWSGLAVTTNEAVAPPPLSRSRVQQLIEEGRVTSDSVTIRSNVKLKARSRIRIELPEPAPLELVPENIPIEILFQDEHLVVVNKPPGLTVHPSETQATGTLVHALLHHVRDLSGIGGVLRPGIVHRLDKDTSGALVVSKSDAAHRKLVETFAAHAIERKYWALCYGVLDVKDRSGELKLESTIGRNPSDRKKMAMNVKDGRRAVTYFRKIEAYGQPSKNPFASLVEARLETGRTHQVRIHLTSLGHSLLGDPVYGKPTSKQPKWNALPRDIQEAVEGLSGQALHARVLGFDHPITGEKLRFEAEPPAAFRLLQQRLERYR